MNELKESEKIFQDEPSSLETQKKMNSRIVQVIEDAPAKTGELYEVKRSKRKAKFWLDIVNIKRNEHFIAGN